jgi:hypothetical protein
MPYQSPDWQRLYQMEWDNYQAARLVQYHQYLANQQRIDRRRQQKPQRELYGSDLPERGMRAAEGAMQGYDFACRTYRFSNWSGLGNVV